jgi:hypothetical protein
VAIVEGSARRERMQAALEAFVRGEGGQGGGAGDGELGAERKGHAARSSAEGQAEDAEDERCAPEARPMRGAWPFALAAWPAG